MNRPPRQVRGVVVALAMSVLALGSMAGVAQAKPPMAVSFHASRTYCVTGSSNRHHFEFNLYRIVDGYHSQLVEGITDVTTHSDDSYRACFINHIVKPGMGLDAVDSDNAHVSWLIPTMTLRIDRVTDVVRGSIGTAESSYALTVRAYQCSAISSSAACPRVIKRSVTPDSTDDYRTDLSSSYDLRGSDQVSVTYRSTVGTPTGNTYKLEQWTPFIDASPGFKYVSGFINPNQTATFKLRTAPGGSLIDSVAATGVNQGQVGPSFSDYIESGNRVTSDFASDAKITIPSTTTTFPVQSGDQKIKTHCIPDEDMLITWDGGPGWAIKTADSQGKATVNLSDAVSDGFRLAHGSVVRVSCRTAAGDSTKHSHFVP